LLASAFNGSVEAGVRIEVEGESLSAFAGLD